nr:MAG TPA: hypothetical protein [Caudoviricetes sp.]DAT22593.1 MAG TPA: hypothetical protein [Caudoviricetes sp.]
MIRSRTLNYDSKTKPALPNLKNTEARHKLK